MTTSPALSSLLRELCALRVLCVKFFSSVSCVAVPILLALFIATAAPAPQGSVPRPYLGFDRNIYAADAALPVLRKTFAFTSYWLSAPPGEKTNTWKGKRELLLSHGYGFLVLYRGRDSRELKTETNAKAKGTQDARAASVAAKKEGFALGTIIFLDIEEGGRLSAAYHVYLRAWSEGLKHAGFLPGVYCSGIPVNEGHGVTITTADDIRSNSSTNDFTFWIYNDACPPSPGCAFPRDPPAPSASGISGASIWQFAQSPRRKEFTAHCPAKYAPDGNCYAPGDTAHKWFLDVNSSTSPDPSGGAN